MIDYEGISGAYSKGVQSKVQEQSMALQTRQQDRLEEDQRMKNLSSQAANVLKFNYGPRSKDITDQYRTGKLSIEEANTKKRALSDEIYTQNPWMEEVIPGGKIYESISPEGFTEVNEQITKERAEAQGLDPNKTWTIKQQMFEGKPIGDKKIVDLTPTPTDIAKSGKSTFGLAERKELKAFEAELGIADGEEEIMEVLNKYNVGIDEDIKKQIAKRLNEDNSGGAINWVKSLFKGDDAVNNEVETKNRDPLGIFE